MTTKEVSIITDNIKKPYGLYVTLFKNKETETMVIRISKKPGIKVPKDCIALNYSDIAI